MTEEISIVLCGLATNGPYPFDDNVEGFCEDCNVAIVWRPHAPEGTHLCFTCGMLRVQRDVEEGETPEFIITQKTADELGVLGYELKRKDGDLN